MSETQRVAPGPRWRTVALAVFVVFHMVSITLMSLPKPRVSDKELKEDSVQDWFTDTHAVLAGLGLPMERDAFADAAIALGKGWLATQSALTAPARVYADWTGAKQSWAMFGGIPDNAAELVIEIEEDGRWREVFVTRQHGLDWQRPVLDQERWRSFQHQFVRKKNRKAYNRFVGWIMEHAREDFPDAANMRVGWRRLELVPPDVLRQQGALPRGAMHWQVSRQLVVGQAP